MPLKIKDIWDATEEFRIVSGNPEATFIQLVTAMGYTRQNGYLWANEGLNESRINEITGFLTRLESER